MIELVTYGIVGILLVILFCALSGAGVGSVILGFLMLPLFCALKGR